MTSAIRVASDLADVQPTLIRQIVDAAPSDAINLGLGQPMLEPPAALVASASRALERVASYSPNAGLPPLRAAIGRHYGLGSSNVMVTVGAEQALFLAICGCCEPGDEILVPDPGFPAYELIASWRGVKSVHYPLAPDRRFDIDVDAVLERVKPGRTRLVVLNTPGNPTGAMLSERSLARLLPALRDAGVGVLSDEVYASMAPEGAPLPSALAPGLGLVVDSMSKRFALMGWRLGWLVAPAEVIRGLVPLQQMTATCAPVPMQAAALTAFTDEGRDAMVSVAVEIRARRMLALERLASIDGLPAPVASSAGLYLFVDVENVGDGDDIALAKSLLDDGVIVIPGQAFGARGRGWVRISCGVSAADLEVGLERFAAGIERVGIHVADSMESMAVAVRSGVTQVVDDV